ncbi:MAG: EAL domain-containing protein [Lachnospiraceae bacterium]|nr:EAL domain-containing protein [Lachnospiraceae bacterium]
MEDRAISGTAITYYGNYSPVGDIIVLASCLAFLVLIFTAYINHTKSFRIFRNCIFLLILTAVSDIVYHMLLNSLDTVPHEVVYAVRITFYLSLFAILFHFVFYAKETLHMELKSDNKYIYAAVTAYALIVLYVIVTTVTRTGFYIDEENNIIQRPSVFPFFFFFYAALILLMLILHKSRIYKQIYIGIVVTTLLSICVMLIQGMHGQSSFTAAVFLFPMYAILYFMHSNPYDPEIGAVNISAFEDLTAYSYAHKNELLIMSLFLQEFDVKDRKFPKELQDLIRYYNHHFFKRALLFRLSGGHIVLVAETAKNPDYRERLDSMLKDFYTQHERFRLDHKIIFLTTIDEIGKTNDYLDLIRYLESRMGDREVKYVDEKDIEAYREHKYIVHELEDIVRKGDLNDSRVKVYCQPVLNTRSGKYDTAEALMRLKLEKMDIVYPDRFIPIAEKYGYIKTLSLIILNKTCLAIRRLISEGYYLNRISVNFSMIDVRESDFSEKVLKIIDSNGIPYEKLAIELTESQSEQDFIIVRDKINELKDSGIKFYLDDFGTGYSNFDRIIELPFDIIKFDRSLVIASNSDTKSETMVSYLAHMFSDMHYSVLYEGIENKDDEQMCIRMCGRYLQGYKYSKPIPIEGLTEYFEKVS